MIHLYNYLFSISLFRCHLTGSKKDVKEGEDTEGNIHIPNWGLRYQIFLVFFRNLVNMSIKRMNVMFQGRSS